MCGIVDGSSRWIQHFKSMQPINSPMGMIWVKEEGRKQITVYSVVEELSRSGKKTKDRKGAGWVLYPRKLAISVQVRQKLDRG